jgi:hypothetical protein
MVELGKQFHLVVVVVLIVCNGRIDTFTVFITSLSSADGSDVATLDMIY